ncbi:hypothetical protein HAALTHF_20500n [Vreelandella aquamarina]|nr:hypothetical protein HAALTHF_20500n [Halomonas axialensis]
MLFIVYSISLFARLESFCADRYPTHAIPCPSQCSLEDFVSHYGDVYEHSPWWQRLLGSRACVQNMTPLTHWPN